MRDLPAGWKRVTLSEIGVEARPGFASGKHNSEGDGIVHLRPMNITREGRIDLSDVRYVQDATDRRVHSGDVLFNNTNSPALVGKTALVNSETPLGYSNHMTRLRPSGELRSDFLAHQLHWLWIKGYFKTVLNNHVNQASVASKRLLETPIDVPSLAEQKLIVSAITSCLDRIASGCASVNNAQRRSAVFRRIVEDRAVLGKLIPPASSRPASAEQDLTTIARYRSLRTRNRRLRPQVASTFRYEIPAHWAIASMDQLCWDIEYGTSTKTRDKMETGDVPVLRMGNIRDSGIVLGNLKYLSADSPEIASLMLEDGDLLFNRTNSAELVGKSAVYRSGFGSASFASYLIRCRFVETVNPDWVNLVVNSSIGRSYIMSVASQQVGQANVNGTKLAKMPIPFPPLLEQEQIQAALAEYELTARRFCESSQECLRSADLLRGLILSAAFSGQLIS
jgi:type I restriction enzyme, S subunit